MKKIIFLFLLGIIGISCSQTEKNFLETKDAYFGLTPPGLIPEVFAPGIVSDTTWAEHCQVAISPKGDEIFFSVYTSIYRSPDGKYNTEQLYHSKFTNGEWTKPQIAPFTNDNKHGGNGGPVFALDGTKLFFYQRKPRDKYMYYIEKENGKWSKEPINVGEPYNTKPGEVAKNWTPVFTKEGNAYKFNQEERVILKYKYEDVTFSQPDTMTIHKDFRLSFNIYVSPEESYFIFSGYHYKGMGGLDLYICFKQVDGSWGYPINMGDKINTNLNERFPVVSPDGKFMFFMRHTETQDIFWVSTSAFEDFEKESLVKSKKPPVFHPIELSSEELDNYVGLYSSPDLSMKIEIIKSGNILMGQLQGRRMFSLECYDKDKFKYDPGFLKIAFFPEENRMIMDRGGSIVEMNKE